MWIPLWGRIEPMMPKRSGAPGGRRGLFSSPRRPLDAVGDHEGAVSWAQPAEIEIAPVDRLGAHHQGVGLAQGAAGQPAAGGVERPVEQRRRGERRSAAGRPRTWPAPGRSRAASRRRAGWPARRGTTSPGPGRGSGCPGAPPRPAGSRRARRGGGRGGGPAAPPPAAAGSRRPAGGRGGRCATADRAG